MVNAFTKDWKLVLVAFAPSGLAREVYPSRESSIVLRTRGLPETSLRKDVRHYAMLGGIAFDRFGSFYTTSYFENYWPPGDEIIIRYFWKY